MRSITLILGGARSGKSRYAETLALRREKRPAYVATSRAWDDDHRARILRHKTDRGDAWDTFEEEKEPSKLSLRGRVVVVDCITLWLTNYLVDEKDDERALALAKEEAERFLAQENDWILVSNEVGLSLHAETVLGRKFTDMQGFMNQYLAQKANHVVLMVAGLPLTLKNELSGAQR